MNVLFLAPVYPGEMQQYVRGLSEIGANVIGVGDTPRGMLPENVKHHLSAYIEVKNFMDEEGLCRQVLQNLNGVRIDKVEALWEPLVLAAARLREILGIPGMSRDTVLGFRDKQLMKERLKKHGLRVPRSLRATTMKQVLGSADEIGFPMIVKPIAGAGSANTYKVEDKKELARVAKLLTNIEEVSCEEYIDGEEFTFDTISINGKPAYYNVAEYLPKPIIARNEQWISPVIITIKNVDQPKLKPGLDLGFNVIKALGMGTGFTHMEWYLKSNGEAVFGEIGCRPGGAHLVDQMNCTNDVDLFREWARAVCMGRVEIKNPRMYNCAIVFKRAMGEGTITHIDGLGEFIKACGPALVSEELLKPGQRRRNWKQTLVSDGFVLLRHPEYRKALDLANMAATEIKMYAK